MVESSLLVRWVIKANLLAELIENPTASIEREKEMNESCPECGGKVSGCKWDKSNGIDLQTKTNHLDNYLDKNKSWNEFIEWANELGETESKYFTYINCADYEKVGLLIQYLKSKGYVDKAEYSAYSSGVMFWDFRGTLALDRLEKLVKELKPKEDDEVERVTKLERLAKELLEVLRK